MKPMIDARDRDLIGQETAALQAWEPGPVSVGLVYGGVSVEDQLYKSKSPVGQLSSTALGDSLTELGLTWQVVDPCTPTFVQDLTHHDVILSNLHGPFGEDGRLQGTLDYLRLPYCGNGVTACAIGADKIKSKEFMSALGIPTPPWQVWKGVRDSMVRWPGRPVMVKPTLGGSSVGMNLVKSENDLPMALAAALLVDSSPVLVEEFITGTPVTVGLLELPGGVVAFPPLATYVHEAEYYDADTKLDVSSQGTVSVEPAEFPIHVQDLVTRYACILWEALDCRGAIRVDFMVTSAGAAYALEINPTPGMSREANFTTGAGLVGLSHTDVVRAYLHEALTRPAYDVPLPVPVFTGTPEPRDAA
jgi:D-alanine-D-alanine ligase